LAYSLCDEDWYPSTPSAPDPIDPYALLIKAAALHAVHLAREEMRGTPVDPEATVSREQEPPDLALLLGGR